MTSPGGLPWSGRLRLRQLALVATLSETLNLRRAASRLSMTQPAASKLLQEIEATLGVQLFERSRTGTSPTVYGNAVAMRARRLFSDLEALRDDIDSIRHGSAGRVRVGVLGSTATVLLTRGLALFKRSHPNARLELREGPHDVLMSELRAGELDVIFGRALTTADDLVFELVFEERFVVVAGPQRNFPARTLGLERLVDEPWILPPAGVIARQRLDSAFLAAAGRTPRNVIESASILVNQTLLQETAMLALMPLQVAAYYAQRGLVRRVPAKLPEILGTVAMLTLRDRPALAQVQAFVASIREAAR